MNKNTGTPSTGRDFDEVYDSPFAHWAWTDVRIPKELKELVKTTDPKTSLELGCGLGRFSTYLAEQGIQATGVDFSSVAIEKAKQRVSGKEKKPVFLVGDVTNLEMLTVPFDVVFDVGCFHCLDEESEQKYVSETHRLLKSGGTLLIWAIDGSSSSSPSGIKLNPEYVSEIFGKKFQLVNSRFSRRRVIASHWYRLVRFE